MKKTSTAIESIVRHAGSEERAIYEVAKAGFDAWDFSMFSMGKYNYKQRAFVPTEHPLCVGDYLSFARKLRRVGEENGIFCNQSHAPFPVFCPEIRDLLKRAIECTAEAGGKICVIHPDNNKTAEENAEMYVELLPFAKAHGVRMATENMWNWDYGRDCAAKAACSHHDDFLAHVLAVNDPYLIACVDVGHAEMRGLDTSAPTMIRTLGKHVGALHLHDVDLHLDLHQIPFSQKVDFDAIIQALCDVGYQGDMTLEATKYLADFTAENYVQGVKNLSASARRLANMFDAEMAKRQAKEN